MRHAFTIGALLLLAGLWLGRLPELAERSFAAHMGLHVGVVAVAAPLLALGLRGGALDPVRRWPAWFPAIPLSMVELAVVWAWHAPVLHHAARHHPAGFVAEQATFLASGVLLWLSAVGGSPGLRAERAGPGIAALLLTSMHVTLLGALLALTPRALYVHAGHEGMATMTALEDQHLGGALMLAIGGASYLAGGLCLTASLLRRRHAHGART